MNRARRVGPLCLAAALLGAWPAAAQPARDPLPSDPSQLLLVGDSITEGIYFFSLSETSARQAWSGHLARRLGIGPEPCRFPEPYPINHLGLAQLGFGLGGLSYPWSGIPGLWAKPRFAARDERMVVAVPGQTVREVLEQSSKHRGRNSSAWTFARLLLPPGLTAVETVEQWRKRPRWIVLFIGANDLLAGFDMVGGARPASPGEFRASYDTLTRRLRAVMAPDAPAVQFLVLTLPDVTRLPFLQPLPGTARDGRGDSFPAGSVASAFLVPYRDRFEPDEVWTPEELEVARGRVRDYNAAIRDIAATRGFTLVALDTLIEELSTDPSFASPNSPYFSPDLQHPSYRTHARIAGAVLEAMAGVAGTGAPPPPGTGETPLPHNGDFSPQQRSRVDAMMRVALLGLRAGPLPPKPTWRLSLEAAPLAGGERAGDAAASVMLAAEFAPCPVSTRWLARGGLSVRGGALVLDAADGGDLETFPRSSLDARTGFAFEPIGMWDWTRLGFGLLYAAEGGFGWYARGEWRALYAETSSRGGWPDRLEAGLAWGWNFGRPGRNGN